MKILYITKLISGFIWVTEVFFVLLRLKQPLGEIIKEPAQEEMMAQGVDPCIGFGHAGDAVGMAADESIRNTNNDKTT